MQFLTFLVDDIKEAFKAKFGFEISPADISLAPTKKEFEGDYTLVLFPWVKKISKSPEEIGTQLGDYLLSKNAISAYNIVKGFLNIKLDDQFWLDQLQTISTTFNPMPCSGKVIVEFSSPNTNKPLHLGHIRNCLLGWSMSNIYKAVGYDVHRTQVINDRGIAICKSMLAWKLFGDQKTPQTEHIKGDHFVGDYYVLFETKFQEEYFNWQKSEIAQQWFETTKEADEEPAAFFKRVKNEYFNTHSVLGKQAREMLLSWEANDPETMNTWKQMNAWVYDGFESTYAHLGVSFDSVNYESQTYLLGKDIVEEGLSKNIFYKKDDGSVWIDLTDVKLDHKLVVRRDGTSIYITQDLGTATKRYEEMHMDKMVYVVADEQDYHFQVLFAILEKLGKPFVKGLYHLNYGMVDLPTGKMKSREGTVVDADDLILEMIEEARANAKERGEIAHLNAAEQENIYRQIGLSALKYFILKVNPRKRMIFDPKESVDLQGNTGPYIQNAFVRIKSILRKTEGADLVLPKQVNLEVAEKDLINACLSYQAVLLDASHNYDPSALASYLYQLAKDFHRFYHDVRILNAETEEKKQLRLFLIHKISETLKQGMALLGIEMPERM